ncbi:hypothetical protein MMC25_007277 [Agyrium rufum]|nr:hypothetical protein [Agyrium rufum]
MASIPTVQQLTAYTDAELAVYLYGNEGHHKIADLDNMTSELSERIRDLPRITVFSRPVDLSQVNARLQNQRMHEGTERSGSSTPSVDLLQNRNLSQLPSPLSDEEDIESYHSLLAHGGRPSHPIHLRLAIYANPEAFGDIVKFWFHQTSLLCDRSRLYAPQLIRWILFERLQRNFREQLLQDEAELFRSAGFWGRKHDKQTGSCSTRSGNFGFDAYVATVHNRLHKHAVFQTVDLMHDVSKQTKLTTFLEYLNFELWHYEKDADFVERYKRWYDGLVRSLLANETDPDKIRYFMDNLKNDLKYVHIVKEAEEESELEIAVEKLEIVRSQYAVVKKEYVRIIDYQRHVEEAERHNTLIQWILQQLPLIEGEEDRDCKARDQSHEQLYGRTNSLIDGHAKSGHATAETQRRAVRWRQVDSSITGAASQPRDSRKRPRDAEGSDLLPAPKRRDRGSDHDRPILRARRGIEKGKEPVMEAPEGPSEPKMTRRRTQTLGIKNSPFRPETQKREWSPSQSVHATEPLRRSARIAKRKANKLHESDDRLYKGPSSVQGRQLHYRANKKARKA